MAATAKPRSSRRLFHAEPLTAFGESAHQLTLPSECELVANTFVVFKWQRQYCVLQANVTMYCWGRRRSGAIEHVLEKYGLTNSPQLYHVNGKEVSDDQWSWLKQIFLVIHRLFDDLETGDTLGKLRWINIMQCSLAYELMRRECYRYHHNLYPKGSVLTSFLKHRGVEVEAWYDASRSFIVTTDRLSTPPPLLSRSQTPPSDRSHVDGSGGCSGSTALSPPSPSAVAGDASLGEREWLSDIHIANLMFLLLCGQLALLEYCSVSPMASRETHTVERTDSGERQDARLRGMSERRNQASHSVRTSSRASTAAQRIRSSAGSLSSLSMSLSRSLTTHPAPCSGAASPLWGYTRP